jgi:spore coat polysaccharide biosynthesis protein SpsF
MSSSRLPGKVMMTINDRPMIYWQIQRILEATKVDELIVATSDKSTDDLLVKFLEDNSVIVHRGSLNNVLSRFTDVASKHPFDALIRLTGDCPLVMPKLIDQMIDKFYEQEVDYLSNTLEPTFPDGLDIEIVRHGVLERLSTFNLNDMEIEHVTYGIYNRPEIFKLSNFRNELDCSVERWTVDYQEDMDFVRAIFNAFSGREAVFTYQDVRDFLKSTPEIKSYMQAHKRNEGLYFDKNRA